MFVINFLIKEGKKLVFFYFILLIITLLIPIIFLINTNAIKNLIDILQSGNIPQIKNAILYFFISQMLVEFFWRMRDFVKIEFSIRLKMNSFNSVIKSLLFKNPIFFRENSVSSIVAISRYISEGSEKLFMIHFKTVRYFIYSITASYTLFRLNVSTGIIIFIWLFLWLSAIALIFPKLSKYVVNLGELKNNFLSNLSDTFFNIDSVFLYKTQVHEKEKLYFKTRELLKKERNVERILWYLWIFQGISFSVCMLSVLLVTMQKSKNIALETGKFAMIIRLLVEFGSQMWSFSEDITDFIEAYGKVRSGLNIVENTKLREIELDKKIQQSETENSIDHLEGSYMGVATKGKDINYHQENETESSHQIVFDKEIIFDKVLFSRPEKEFFFDCRIPTGKNIALIGSSGSGKSTFIQLLLEILKPDSGSIYIPCLNDFSYLSQDPKLFNASIRYNLKYGLNREPEEIELEKVSRICNLDFIKNLSQGYDTIVSDSLLSKGQVQRILIGRCLLRESELLILDEPTSALDSQNEKEIIDIVLAIPGTKLIVSHKPLAIEKADFVILLENGKIVATGSYDYFKSKYS